eukprot:g31384.t1
MAADDPDAEGLWKNLLSEGVLQHFKDSMNEEKPSEFLHLVLKGVPESLRSEVWRTLLRARAAEIDAQVARGEKTKMSCLRNDRLCDFPPLSDVELDPKVSRQIELDLPRRLVTFPEIPHFDLPKQQKMEQILRSYAYHEPQIGYCQGMNYIAGVLLLVLGNVADAYQAFVVFMNGFGLAGNLISVKLEGLPQLHDHFCEVKYRFPQFPVAWFMSLFVTILPLPLVKCFWDAVVLKGGPALVVLCVMTLRALRPILMFLGEDDVSFFFDAIKKPTSNSWLERFLLRLFKQELSACEGQNFQAEFVEVEKVLSQIPERCTDLEGLRTEFYFPSSSVLAARLKAKKSSDSDSYSSANALWSFTMCAGSGCGPGNPKSDTGISELRKLGRLNFAS